MIVNLNIYIYIYKLPAWGVLLHPTRYWAQALDKASNRPTGLKCIFQSHAKMEATQALLQAWSCMRTLRSPPDGRA